MNKAKEYKALAQRHADILAELRVAEREAAATDSLIVLPTGILRELVCLNKQLNALEQREVRP